MVVKRKPLPWDPIAEAERQWRQHGWSEEADGMAAVTSIMRAQQLMLARVEVLLRPFKLTFARYEMLRLLSFTRGGALPMASASARLQVHPTSVTNTTDRLEAAGLIERTAHPTDGRATLIRITQDGRRLVDEATEVINREFFRNVGIAQDDVIALVEILSRFRRDAGDFEDSAPQ
ncbi:MAG: MarR family transcriptional regulator [Microbacteriaceae bacterium]|nr:MarR family transcriptional regulator [Microbacteriaceae bacterium]